jgi:2-polyprenyl-3-methyl-5-hydroxy-6-metoxy-1,4-benzoquinol methylase
MGNYYDAKLAASELAKYRADGPRPWTRTLIDALKAEGVEGSTLLDIGGGIGAIQHELLDAGVAKAISVDASGAYIDAAREESERRGHDDRVAYHHGDFVELAEALPPADIVTLDRVLNVYPDWKRLAALSAARARRLYGLVYPRNTTMVKVVISAINMRMRLKGQDVRAAIVPAKAIEELAAENGLRPHLVQVVGPAWQVAVYRRG